VCYKSKFLVCFTNKRLRVCSFTKRGAYGEILSSEEIGRNLKQLRERAGISQEKLAEHVGISKGQIQKYEYGRDKMNTDKLQRVADALSASVQEFFATGMYCPLPFPKNSSSTPTAQSPTKKSSPASSR